MKLPVTESTAPVAGNVATPVYVEEESLATHVEGGSSTPVYAVTDADIAAGRFVVSGGPVQRVAISRGTRPSLGGPAIPVRHTGGNAYFATTLVDYAKKTWESDVLAIYMGAESSGSVMYDSSGSSFHGVYTGTQPTIVSPFGSARRLDSLTDAARYHSAALEAAWNWSQYTFIAPARINSSAVWTDGTQRHLWRLVNAGLGVISQVTKHTVANQIQFECNVNGVNTQVTRSLGGSLSWFLTVLTFHDTQNRSRFYTAARGIPLELTAERAQTNSPSGALSSDRCTLGCSNYSTLTNLFDGDLWPLVILKREATQAELAPLSALVE